MSRHQTGDGREFETKEEAINHANFMATISRIFIAVEPIKEDLVMTPHHYLRVIPRDLFNEANLLKCYGQLWLNLDRLNLQGVGLEHDGSEFEVEQDLQDGSLTIVNVPLNVRGEFFYPYRPLNSRRPYPLYLTTEEGTEIEVFNDDGSFTDDMMHFLNGGNDGTQ
jgi:hypothetical protein